MLALLLLSAAVLIPEGRQPQLASDGATVALVYGNAGGIFAAVSKDGGTSFGAPVKVAAPVGLMLGRHRGPRVAVAGKTIAVTAIAAGELLSWRSVDGGSKWAGPVTINDVKTAAREGLHNTSAGPKGSLISVWLDLRKPGMQLYSAQSKDGGATWSENRLVYASPDGNICECCHPSVAVDGKGTIHVMFRNWLSGSRDMYLATSTDGGMNFKTEKLGEGTWKLNACPMDGGGLVIGKRGPVTIWRREKQVHAQGPLGEGKDAAIAVGPDGRETYAWTTGMEVMVDGKPKGHGGYASLTGGRQVVAAWESGTGIQVERVR